MDTLCASCFFILFSTLLVDEHEMELINDKDPLGSKDPLLYVKDTSHEHNWLLMCTKLSTKIMLLYLFVIVCLIFVAPGFQQNFPH